jgi:LysR family transcriptional regulator, transcriptional activator of nhaA
MEWLNYHHLLYFYVVAREGSIAKACGELRLAQPTISGQIKALEDSLGERLFERKGRGLVLTEIGELAYRYAEQIFSLGAEMREAIKGTPIRRPLVIGIADVMPKLIAYKLLEPIRRMREPVKVICREGRPDKLMADLALHQLDIILSDSPMSGAVKVKAYSHLLGECGVSFLGTPQLALKYRKGFPKSLDGAPVLLPSDDSVIRGALELWFEDNKIKPQIIGEFADTALLNIFGEAGDGIFPVPDLLESQLRKQLNVQLIGRAEDVSQRFYIVSVERKLKHPAVVAISEGARTRLFD